MKRLILLELILLFLATTFQSDSTGGWVQQSISIGNKTITDIQFLDSLNGWVVTDWGPTFDTAYVFKTGDGGSNWNFQYRFHGSFNAVQMTDYNTGYIVGSTGSGKVWKTINGGINWSIAASFSANPIRDLSFVSKDTGWVCSDDGIDGGIFKTTNGGVNWQQQLNNTYSPMKLFFINKDTGYFTGQTSKLYKTTNSGVNWNLLYSFPGNLGTGLFFSTKDTGFVSGGGNGSAIKRTTDGGVTWQPTNTTNGGNIFFINSKTGWFGGVFNEIGKSTDGGINWYLQTTPIFNNGSIMFVDTLHGWAGGSGMVHTTDGGGPPVGIISISNEAPKEYKLFQNYPNPFNPATVIKYQVMVSSIVKLVVYDMRGKEISILVNQKQNPGTYDVDFSGNNFSSGVYFYSLFIGGVLAGVKKMILLK